MFSLGIYDTLTAGLADRRRRRRRHRHHRRRRQRRPDRRDPAEDRGAPATTGAELFLVPPDNCDDALGAPNGDMRLVRADTMHDAVDALETWADDPDADLPSADERERR